MRNIGTTHCGLQKGEQLQDSYHVRGISVLRIVTGDGNFDYDIPIDVEVNEIPF
jgi:hypothetical protein